MKTSSKKSKGRSLQNLVRDKLLTAYPELGELDIKSAVMGESGEDIKLSLNALKLIPYTIECKNLAKVAVYKFFQQAESHREKLLSKAANMKIEPLVVIKQNRSKPLVILDLDEFMRLLTSSQNQKSD